MSVARQAFRRVAITGMGAISALGHDSAALWQAASAGQCGITGLQNGPIAAAHLDRLTVRQAARIQGFDPAAHFLPRVLAGLDRVAQLGLVAAREAMAQAGLAEGLGGCNPRRAGAVLAASIGQDTFDSASNALFAGNARRLPPLTVPRIMPSAVLSHISIAYGLRGAAFATASACASATHAIGVAFHMVRAGLLDVAISGGSDASLQFSYLKAWDALRVLSADVCRPFSADRAGLVLGEGAGILVLEDMAHAQARGAPILGEILGFGMTADAADMTAPSAEGAAQAMADALADAGLAPDAIDHVNAHGTGTRLNDSTEVAALRLVFGTRLSRILVSSNKSMLGHCLNAAGALEAVLSLLALRHGLVPPTINFRAADPECDIDCVPNVARPAPIARVLSNSFAFGGLNASLLLGSA